MNKVLVTGGCGLLGSHVCELFSKKGWEVIAYDNLTKFEYSRAFKDVEAVRNYNLIFLERLGVTTVVADILDVKTLKKAMHHCNLVVHCAAQPAMTVAIEDPQYDLMTNVHGTLNVLEAARFWGAAVVNCSTIHVYGNNLNNRLRELPTRFDLASIVSNSIDESEPTLDGAVTPLHASKLSAEHYVRAYADTYNVRAANFRLTGMYGPRQFGGEDHGWVANFTIRTLLDQPIKVFGSDKQVRDILYIEDAARAFLLWYNAGCPSGTYNVGGGTDTIISIHELFSLLHEITGKRSHVELLPKRHGDLWWFVSDYSQAREAFHWEPQIMPDTGVQKLVDWISKERSLFE